MSVSAPKGMGDGDNRAGHQNEENWSAGRREFIERLAKAAILPAVVATFLASDVTDAAAS